MRIGRIKLLWVKRDVLGRPLHPWEEITLDQLTPEARKLIQKMARVCARDFYDETRETFEASLRAELQDYVDAAVMRATNKPAGPCLLCGNVWDGMLDWRPYRDGWAHVYPESAQLIGCPGVMKTELPEQKTTNGEQHP